MKSSVPTHLAHTRTDSKPSSHTLGMTLQPTSKQPQPPSGVAFSSFVTAARLLERQEREQEQEPPEELRYACESLSLSFFFAFSHLCACKAALRINSRPPPRNNWMRSNMWSSEGSLFLSFSFSLLLCSSLSLNVTAVLTVVCHRFAQKHQQSIVHIQIRASHSSNTIALPETLRTSVRVAVEKQGFKNIYSHQVLYCSAFTLITLAITHSHMHTIK